VVLFDEIEKAHPDVFNTLLQILEEGRLTDAQGRSTDFRNTVLIMTSNLGTQDLRKANVGFGKNDEALSYQRMRDKVNEALKGHFRPEFLNRIDEVIVFHELGMPEVVRLDEQARYVAIGRPWPWARTDATGKRVAGQARLRPTAGRSPTASCTATPD
jgi:ATP-dependent Clp protease ATP-binding subunit ClpA